LLLGKFVTLVLLLVGGFNRVEFGGNADNGGRVGEKKG